MATEEKNSKENRKSRAGFLYLFAALARRASQENGVAELQRLSGLIEKEIAELQKSKRARVRDVLRKEWTSTTRWQEEK